MSKTLGLFAVLVLVIWSGTATAGSADSGATGPRIVSKNVTPVYPPAAQAARFEGSLVLAALVRADGTVDEVEVLESDHPRVGFEEAAIDAVRRWRFEPALQGDTAVDSYTMLRLQFRTPGTRQRPDSYVVGGTVHLADPDVRKLIAAASVKPQPPAIGSGGGKRSGTRSHASRFIAVVGSPPPSGLYDPVLLVPDPVGGPRRLTAVAPTPR